MKLYEQLAEKMIESIRAGVLPPCQRIPSVRMASSTYNLSQATVFQAYYLLERLGYIEARPRSGYFVTANVQDLLNQPAPELKPLIPTDVGVSDLVFSVLGSVRDPNIIPFGSAFPDPNLFPLQRLARSMTSVLHNLPPQDILSDLTTGNAHLRRQISLRYLVNNVYLSPDEIVITNGAMEALNICLQTVTKPGDLVAIESPTFYAALQILERLELKAVEIPVDPQTGLDINRLERSLRQLPIKACWFMSSFHNPLGVSMDDAKKQKIYELVAEHDIPLIEDDVYSELHFSPRPHTPIKALDKQGKILHCGSFSKSLAPGYRIGWVAAGRYADQINRQKLMTTISPSIPAQLAIADYLQHGGYDRHLRKLRAKLQEQQSAMLAAIATYFPENTRVTYPQGGYFLWLELPAHVDSLQLFSQALNAGISIAPGPIFSAARQFQHSIRLNYGQPWTEVTEQAMARLGDLVKGFQT